MHENVIKLKKYDLDWWIDDYIEPVVANIVKTFKEEEIDELFWQSIYKHYSHNGSGSFTKKKQYIWQIVILDFF